MDNSRRPFMELEGGTRARKAPLRERRENAGSARLCWWMNLFLFFPGQARPAAGHPLDRYRAESIR